MAAVSFKYLDGLNVNMSFYQSKLCLKKVFISELDLVLIAEGC